MRKASILAIGSNINLDEINSMSKAIEEKKEPPINKDEIQFDMIC